jgi:predicted ATPase
LYFTHLSGNLIAENLHQILPRRSCFKIVQIESIEIKNYRLFQDVKISRIPRLCVLVGANGSGKSTLFDVFSFLKDALAGNVTKAVAKRGGFKEIVSRGHFDKPIQISMQFRLDVTGYQRLVTYVLELTQKKGKVLVSREILRYKRGKSGKPFHFLDFSKGIGYAINNEEDFSKTEEQLGTS